MTASDIGDLLFVLLRATAVLSVAAGAVIALRRPLRRCFGPGVAYAAWLALPLCPMAALLPAAPTGGVLALRTAATVQPLVAAMRGLTQTPSSTQAGGPILLGWLAGALYFAVRQMRQQRAYLRSLGQLTRRGGISYAESRCTGPALVGLRRPAIVVPADFDQRYTSRERELILAHERAHARRRDPLANAAGAALRCLNWFNPLIHVAERLMRIDQELACDAEVIRRHPNRRRSYADAMLKTQLSAGGAPLACQWQSTHPLNERIMSLNRTTPHALRLTGSLLIASAMAAASWAAWAAKPTPAGPLYDVAVRLDIGGASSTPHLHTHAGETATLRSGEGAQQWETRLTLKPTDDGKVFISSSMKHGGKEVGKPGLLVALGEPGKVRIELDDKSLLEMQLTVTQLAQ